MAISLQKGQKVDLTKGNASLTRVLVGLGWDTKKYDGGFDFDLDAAAFLLAENGKVGSDADFVFYNNLEGRGGAVKHMGDNLTGAGDGDDEVVIIDFAKMPPEVAKVAITVTIHDAVARGQNFGQVTNAFVRVAQMANDNDMQGTDLMRYDLGEDFSIETAVVVCEVYRHAGEWKFSAVGSGYQGGLEALCRSYGVNV